MSSPERGTWVFGDLHLLGGGRAKELKVLGWMGMERRSKARDGLCWGTTACVCTCVFMCLHACVHMTDQERMHSTQRGPVSSILKLSL